MAEIPITVYGDVDDRAVDQLRRCAQAGDALRGALCADGHVGYSQPIGGAVAYPDHISPSGVGYDIACLAAGTPVATADGYWRPIEDVGGGDAALGWDGRVLRTVLPRHGAVPRGERPLRRLTLAAGRELLLTDDHRVRTRLGWKRADELCCGEAVACSSFVGLPYERAEGFVDIEPPESPSGRARDRIAALAARDLWPLRIDSPRLPALLRLLAYCAGDGNVGVDGKTLAWYTSAPDDADDLGADLIALGFQGRRYDRADRGQCVLVCRSVELHALFVALGCPVGKKVYAWPERPFDWLLRLPAW
jgi:tRNA-splicing ligase RtcB